MKNLSLVLATALLGGNLMAEESQSPFEKAGISTSANVAITSHYVWRGNSEGWMTNGTGKGNESDSKLAIQGGFDFAHESGVYVGTWISNVYLGVEHDLYVGFSNDIGDTGVSYDVGYIQYLYPSHEDSDFAEGYLGLSYSISGVDLGVIGYQDFENETLYAEGSIGYDLGMASLSATVGSYVVENYGPDSGYHGSNFTGTIAVPVDKFEVALTGYSYVGDKNDDNDDSGVIITVSTSIE
jgi:uncharacterized protein (TIGR02001 family)